MWICIHTDRHAYTYSGGGVRRAYVAHAAVPRPKSSPWKQPRLCASADHGLRSDATAAAAARGREGRECRQGVL